MGTLLVAAIIFMAVFTHSLTGFGVALVSMALLPGLLGMQVAAPLVALVALILEAILIARYRFSLNLQAIWPLILASLIGIPVGVWGLRGVDKEVFLAVLGIVIAGYAVYALFQLRLPVLRHPAWAYGAGFLAGLFGGAYNTSGPPVIIYADSQGWPPDQFKGNLQGFFVLIDFMVVASHALDRNLTVEVWKNFLWCLLPIAAGIFLGTRFDRAFNPAIFRKVALLLLLVMGLRLLW